MQYPDIIREVFNTTDASNYGDYGIDGTDESKIIIMVNDWESASKLNDLFEEAVTSKNIQTTDVNFNNTFPYLEFVVGNELGNWGFTDEYYSCDHCNKIFPRLVNYTFNYFASDYGELVCPDCVKEDPEDYLSHLMNNPEDANRFLDEKDLIARGFVKANETSYANGLYDEHDDPKQIYKAIKEQNENTIVLFSISNHNSYEVEFDVYVKE